MITLNFNGKSITLDFFKYPDGLVPAIIQDYNTKVVLMLGYVNAESLCHTILEGKVMFYSRSKERLWTKGETSGNYLMVKEIRSDCDLDAILIKVIPTGPVCHTGSDTCFEEKNTPPFLKQLEAIIEERKALNPEESYVARMFNKGINKIAQKVGEEAVEMIIEAKDNDKDLFLNESADLLFHYLLLLNAKGYNLQDVVNVLETRHNK